MELFWILVSPLPIIYDTDFGGAQSLPSLTGSGVYLQLQRHFYELVCSSTSCDWNLMEQTLADSVVVALMMYLPYGYMC